MATSGCEFFGPFAEEFQFKHDQKQREAAIGRYRVWCAKKFGIISKWNQLLMGRVAIPVANQEEPGLLLRETVSEKQPGDTKKKTWAFIIFPSRVVKFGPLSPQDLAIAEKVKDPQWRLPRISLRHPFSNPIKQWDIIDTNRPEDADLLKSIINTSIEKAKSGPVAVVNQN